VGSVIVDVDCSEQVRVRSRRPHGRVPVRCEARGDAAVGRYRGRFGVMQRLIPKLQEAAGKVVRKTVLSSGSELFGCLFK
jgi:hypothetical protein